MSTSKKCLKGLHIQIQKPQAKIITVVSKIMDVAVDLKKFKNIEILLNYYIG